MYMLDTVINMPDRVEVCNNGYIYCMFVNPNSTPLCILEYVAEFCKTKDIFDMITTTGMFEDGSKSKLLQGTGHLYYYMYNLQLPYIRGDKNALITI
jgi:hypothetical protein